MLIVAAYLTSGRQSTSLGRDARYVPAQFDFLDQEGRVRLAIFGTFTRSISCGGAHGAISVSYTHLTLPTILRV